MAYGRCSVCKRRVALKASSAPAVVCRACREHTCYQCGQTFTGKHGGGKLESRAFCSVRCQTAYWRDVRSAAKAAAS